MNITELRSIFKIQLDQAPQISGAYLSDLSVEEKIEELMARPNWQLKRKDTEKFVQDRIKLWDEHQGDRLLFFGMKGPAQEIEVSKIWESLIGQLLQYDYIETVGEVPIFGTRPVTP